MADQAIHVNGPALIYVKGGPFGSRLTQLGISEDGVDIEINSHDSPVMTDAAGPALPADVQDMGEDANVRCGLSVYDYDALVALRKRGNAKAEGVAGSRGRLLGQNGHAFVLVIASETDEPWRFFTTILRGPRHVKPSTKYSVQRLNFYSWALVGPSNSANGVKLYDHTFG